MAEEASLYLWLQTLNLQHYHSNFTQHGITSKSQCQDLDEQTLTELGITLPGHRTRILSHLPVDSVDKCMSGGVNETASVDYSNLNSLANMSQPVLPPKKKSLRDSYLYQVPPDLKQGATIAEKKPDTLNLATDTKHVTPQSSPRPVPRPRSKKPSTPSSTPSTPTSVLTTPSSEKPVPTPRASRIPQGALSPSIKLDDACMSETSTESVFEPMKNVDSVSLYENLLPSARSKESDKRHKNDLETVFPPNSVSSSQQSKLVEGFSDKQHLYQNVDYDSETQSYNVKQEPGEEIENSFEQETYGVVVHSHFEGDRDTDICTAPPLQASCAPPKVGIVDEKQDNSDTSYGAIWFNDNSTAQRSSSLMKFPSLEISNGNQALTNKTQIPSSLATRDSSLFDFPPPEFAPPPLPTSITPVPSNTTPSNILDDFDPLSRPPMPPVPPRPLHEHSNSTEPYMNVPGTLTGESLTLPQDVYSEPDQDTPWATSVTADPFQNVDPFSEFEPEYQDFDVGANNFTSPFKSPKGASQQFKNWPVDFGNDAGAANFNTDNTVNRPNTDNEAIYEAVDDNDDFDPFGLKSIGQAIGGLTRSGSTESGHNLDTVPPPPAWHQTVHDDQRMYSYAESALPGHHSVPELPAPAAAAGVNVMHLGSPFRKLNIRFVSPMVGGANDTDMTEEIRTCPGVGVWDSGMELGVNNLDNFDGVYFCESDDESVYASGIFSRDDADSVSSSGSLEDLIDSVDAGERSHDGGMTHVEILPVSAMSKRRRERSGYLYKQGGVNQNRGWKKRWVIFDGNTLRYYADAKTQVSKRIVPVSCMKHVDIDVKPPDACGVPERRTDILSMFKDIYHSSDMITPPSNAKQYKFRLQCTNRTFLFATDKLDDCTMWSQTLMEAIHVYSSSPREVLPGGDMADPDLAAWITFNKNHFKYYVALKNNKLCYYQNTDDFKMASPLHEIEMKLSAIKKLERTKLQLSIHYKHFILHFDSSSDAMSWKMAIEDAITNALGDNDVVDEVMGNEANAECADCKFKEAHWASMNLGIVMCLKCAGIHRGFHHGLSKVRSLRMDTRIWNSSLKEMIKVIGNENANKFWCCHMPAERAIDEHSSAEERKLHIHDKYREKKYADIHEYSNDKAKLNEALLDAAQTDDIYLTMKILMSGADVLYCRPDEPNSTAYELATAARQRIQAEFLLQNGGDKTKNFMPGSEDASLVAKLRAEIQLQGNLYKTGPNTKDLKFMKRWCILEHGHFSYFKTENSREEQNRLENESILCIQATSYDKYPACFEMSTKKNRIYLFSAPTPSEKLTWIRAITQIFCPVTLMELVKQKEFSLASYAHLKLGFTGEWQQTFLVLENRTLYFTDRGQQECQMDSVDLRRVSHISKLTDSSPDCDACLERGPQIAIHSSDHRALYLQSDLARDTDRLFAVLEVAVKRGGSTLEDQVLNNEGVPVIVDSCLNFIETHGIKQQGIYREAAQNSKIDLILERFATDARSLVLRMGDHTVHEVCNCLKRFLRNLVDPLLTAQLYSRWLQTAEISGDSYHHTKLGWYRYLLEQLPRVNYLTLRRIASHLSKISRHSEHNLMGLDKLTIAFGSTLMKSALVTENTPSTNNIGAHMQLEMKTISDIVDYYEWLFDIKPDEPSDKVKKKLDELMEVMSNTELTKSRDDNIMISVHHDTCTGASHTVTITKETTVAEVIHMAAPSMNSSPRNLALYEMVGVELERPLHNTEAVWPVVFEWQKWSKVFGQVACLCLKSRELMEKIEDAYNPTRALFPVDMKYAADKKKFVKTAFEFTQSKLSSKNAGSWNIEDLCLYLGYYSKRSPPTKFAITFHKKGERVGEDNILPFFGRTMCFTSKAEQLSWYSAMWVAQSASSGSGDNAT